MFAYIIRRFGSMIIILFCVSIITFSLMHLVPGDPAYIIAERLYGHEVSEETVEKVKEELGLDRPVWAQYGRWVSRALQGDFGTSYRTGLPVLSEILGRLPATLQLALAASFISLIIAIPIAVISARKAYSLVDHASMLGAMVGVSMPNFWLGLLLILVFSVHLGWFPVYGRGGLAHLILPAITLGTGMAAVTARLTRSSLLEILKMDYIRTARAKGLEESTVVQKHALKNAFIPVVTVIGLQFGALLEGAVIVEVIFAWPGVGRLLVESIFARDFPVIQGCVFIIAVMYIIVNLLVDLSYPLLDPKIVYEG
jgi:peptide/nickel transport system permease protein